MAKVITTIAADNGMDINEICSFRTKNYVGIWDENDALFTLVKKKCNVFAPFYLEPCDDLKELDDMVYEECKEHIEEVFESGCYTFIIEEKDLY